MKQIITFKLRASTLVELMIVMIVMGIVVGMVFEGVDLVRRYSKIVVTKIESSSKLYEDYRRIDMLISPSDSLVDREGVHVYRNGNSFSLIKLADSVCIIDMPGFSDTLSIKVANIEAYRDSLVLGTNNIRLVFEVENFHQNRPPPLP